MKTYILKPTMTLTNVSTTAPAHKPVVAPIMMPRPPAQKPVLPARQPLPTPVLYPDRPTIKLGLDVHLQRLVDRSACMSLCFHFQPLNVKLDDSQFLHFVNGLQIRNGLLNLLVHARIICVTSALRVASIPFSIIPYFNQHGVVCPLDVLRILTHL